jgi:hypothetical protein
MLGTKHKLYEKKLNAEVRSDEGSYQHPYKQNMAAIIPTLSGDLFHTMTELPEFSRFLTIPEPIIPGPRNPNFSAEGRMFFSFSVCDTLSTSSGGVI